MKLTLKLQWSKRIKLWEEGNKLRDEGNKAEGEKLWAEGNKLWMEGDRLRSEGEKLWTEGILEVFGNIKIKWKYVEEKNDYECYLENGEVYKP